MTSELFNNSKNLSLDQWKIQLKKKGVSTTFPALHKQWSKKMKFRTYTSLMMSYGEMKKGVDLEEWIYKTGGFKFQLHILLNLRHHEFWSTMVYSRTALSAVVSFLQHATPFYKIVNYTPTSDDYEDIFIRGALELYEEILRAVVRIIWRLLTSQESPSAWLTPKHHADLLYDNFLITVPILFDLIMALGNLDQKNVEVLQKIFTNLFEIQPLYSSDMQEGLAYFASAFASIQIQVDNEGCEGAGGGVLCDDDSQTPYDDVVLYIMDCAYTLSILLEVYPQITPIVNALELDLRVANFYDNTLPLLYKYIHTINPKANSLNWLNEGRQIYLNAFRSVVKYYIAKILKAKKSKTANTLIELLSECLTTNVFIVDYQRQFPVEIDVKMLQKECPEIKLHKIKFIISSFKKALSSDTAGTIGGLLNASGHNQPTSSKSKKCRAERRKSNKSLPTPSPSLPPAAIPNRDIDLEVNAVLEILPELGTGFIRRLLARYENSEQALAAIFDENLPPDLANSNRSEVYIPPDPQDKLIRETGLRHYNVFDGDDYDVMSKDKPKCIIKKGKGFPGVPQNAEQLLDDKKELQGIKHRYQEYSLVAENVDGNADEYNDEYDDSYDAIIDGQPQMQNKRKMFAGNRVNETSRNVYDDEGEDDNSKDINRPMPKRDIRKDFCENPEDVRARYAARQQAKWGHKTVQGPARDVVGAAKGQGQSNETVRNRANKEANKSSRANHNRKSGAAFKRNKGMLP